MERAILAGIFALAASTVLAQSEPASDPAGAGEPANLCQELLAFVETSSSEGEAAAAPAAAADDSAEGVDAAEGQPAEEGAETEAAAAGDDSAPASGEAIASQPVEETSSAQAASGQTGPAHGAPEPNSDSTEMGGAKNADLKAGMSAPTPTDGESAPKDPVLSVAEAEELASANDIAACQNAARDLRLAGVAMPAPLLALTALNLQYQSTAAPEAEDANASPTEATETENAAPQTQGD